MSHSNSGKGTAVVASLSLAALACGSLFIASEARAEIDHTILIDDFANDLAMAPNFDFSATPVFGPQMLGGRRTMYLQNINGDGMVTSGVSDGMLNINKTSDAYPDVSAIWDAGVGQIGLGGIDITQGGANDRFRMNVSTNGSATIYVFISQTFGMRSLGFFNFSGPASGDFDLFFSDIGTDGNGPGADFHSVGAIYIDILLTNNESAAPDFHIDNFSIVPAPGAAALLGLSGLLSSRRRR